MRSLYNFKKTLAVQTLFALSGLVIFSPVFAAEAVIEKVVEAAPIIDDLSGKIAFVVESGTGANKTSTIVVTDAANTDNTIPIASVKGFIQTLSASANGRQLAFTAGANNLYRLIYVADAYVPNSARLVTPEKANHSGASISPDGTQILYSSDRDITNSGNSNMDIFVADIGGGNPRRVINHPAADIAPNWSPDATGFIFTSDRVGGNNRPRLYRYNFATGAIQALGIGGGYASNGQYNANGTKIAFNTFSQGAIADVGGASRVVSSIDEPPGISPNGQNYVYPRGNVLTIVTPSRTLTIDPLAKLGMRGKISKPVWLKSQQ